MSRQAGIVSFTACALQASAFLLPPNLAPASDKAATALSLDAISYTGVTNALVQLPCAECAFSRLGDHIEENEDEPLFWIQGGANSVLVNFTVTDGGQRLQANGETIYPLNLLETSILGSDKVYVDQVRSGVSVAEVEAGSERTIPLEVTGHGVSVMDQGDALLVAVQYSIFDLENQPVRLSKITISVLNMPDGIAIVEVEMDDPHLPPSKEYFGPAWEDTPEFEPENDEHIEVMPQPLSDFEVPAEPIDPEFGFEKECHGLPAALCKFRNTVEAKIMGLGKKPGCHGRKGGSPWGGKLPSHIRPHFGPDDEDRRLPQPYHGHHFHAEMEDKEPPFPHHHGRPHHMRPHHHGHHRHHFMHAFARGLAAVLIPTMAGIAVGMTVSLIGLVVGRLIGFLWFKLYRRGRRGYASVALDDTAVDAIDDGKEVVYDEPLPVYESAPAYEDIVTETK